MGMMETIDRIFYNYKGILAADESFGTVQKRLASVGMESTVETRHDYRHTLFSTSGISPFIGGAILFDETLRSPLTIEPLRAQNIQLGIKVDKGVKDYGHGTVTEGLDGLAEDFLNIETWGPPLLSGEALLSPHSTLKT